jgi:hypothetical protein
MARPQSSRSLQAIINSAVDKSLSRVLTTLQRAVSEAQGASRGAVAAARRPGPKRRRGARREMSRWVADNRARRVPTFVIELTGLDTKKKIVARYGANAAFAKGKPAPSPRATTAAVATAPKEAARVAKAKPPVLRKAAAK